MAAHSFSSLKDMLKCPSTQKPKFMDPLNPKAMATHSEDPHVPKMFNELFLEKNPSSPKYSPFPPLSSSSSISLSSSFSDLSLQTKTKELNEETNGCRKNFEMEKKKSVTSHSMAEIWRRRVFPPPISCLKLFKKGKPYVYVNSDGNDDRFVLEEIRIPTRTILRAYRENGHFKLYFVHPDEEIFEEEEEEEGYEKISHDEVEDML